MIYIKAAEDHAEFAWRCAREDGAVDLVHDGSPPDQRLALENLLVWRNKRPASIEEQVRVLSWRGLWHTPTPRAGGRDDEG